MGDEDERERERGENIPGQDQIGVNRSCVRTGSDMNSVGMSYGLPGLAMTSGVEDYVLIHVQRLVGKTDSIFLGHDRG